MPAHYEVVDGIRLPARLSGHPALDFCNTWAGWDGQATWDYLQGYDHLAVWAGFVDLLPPDRVAGLRREGDHKTRAAAAALARAREFRASLYDVLLSRSAGPAWDAVANETHAAAAAAVLRRAGEGFRWEVRVEGGLAAPLHAVAWSAAGLLTSADLLLVRACPGGGCGWLFLDRRGRRRWCTMAICGNRDKVRRFAARHREDAR
jgi:predicted RNA-binding Zn ribbon-like protein